MLVVALDAPIPAAFSNADVLVLAPALNSWLRHWDRMKMPLAAERRNELPRGSIIWNEAASTHGVASATPTRCKRSRTPP